MAAAAQPSSASIDDDELPQLPNSYSSKLRYCCCCCIWFPWTPRRQYSSSSGGWQNYSNNTDETRSRETWWRASAFKIREWSEIAAGPRWKTFIRRFRQPRFCPGRTGSSRFRYDPLSYAQNFDEGGDDDDGGVEDNGGGVSSGLYRGFSSRWVPPPPRSSSLEMKEASKLPAVLPSPTNDAIN